MVVGGQATQPAARVAEAAGRAATSREKIRSDAASDDFREAEIRHGIYGVEHLEPISVGASLAGPGMIPEGIHAGCPRAKRPEARRAAEVILRSRSPQAA